MWSGAVGNEQGRCLGSGLESCGDQTSRITLRGGEMRGRGQEGLVLPLAWGAAGRVLASASPVTCHPGSVLTVPEWLLWALLQGHGAEVPASCPRPRVPIRAGHGGE